ncbi:glutamate receptor 3.3-like [Tasmannia lanceolata]|uniref:glutamate receptor 3.3-like n=1 Tax=Tasmannia lanceolata TaxID=3420 RepID=UPI004063AE31
MHNSCLLSKAKMLPSRLYSLPSPALFFFLFSFLPLSHAAKVTAQLENGLLQANIGAIIDANSHIGREEKIAMEIAIQDFNNSSPTTRLALHISDSSGSPLQAVSAVEELINQNQAQVIVGMASWEEAMLVADAINSEQVPIISLTTASVTPPLMMARRPFLIPMGNNNSAEMKCVAAIVDTCGWRRVNVIYEDSTYGGHAGSITLLSDSLREVGSEIENQLVLPPLASLSDPETSILEELEKLNSQQCRVFVLLHSSLPLAVRLFVEANKMGMMGKGYVWITTSSITSLVDSFNSSVISNIQGVIGIKPYFSETSKEFRAFNIRFRRNFQLEYSDQEENPNPGIFALRAYDSIWAVGKAIERNSTGGEHLVESILSNNFSGLSGKISFEDGKLTGMPTFQIINVIGKSYRELGFWSPEFGFSNSAIEEKGGVKLESKVFWPGGQTSTPKGWVAATDAKPLIIGVPGKTAFNQFVKVVNGSVSGFCIDVFEEAVKLLPYDLPHEFVPYDGTYEDLVREVYYKKFDAVVGDTTILAERSEYVEFSQPYDESGLSMLVTVKEEGSRKAWLFMRPFTKPMWAVTGAIFVYTGFVVWFLEHRRNPDFRGPWRSQVGTMLWFTFSTLFFAHTKVTAKANIGAIIDTDSRIGREEKIAMEIAIQDFNTSSANIRLVLHIQNSGGNHLQAASAAEELINKQQAQLIIGTASWDEAVHVADARKRDQVPIVSLTAPSITPPLMTVRWPFLVPMANNGSAEMKCIADIIGNYGWRRVTAIYEDNTFSGGDAGTITLLSDALRNVSSEIEYQLALPPLASLSDPETSILEELEKLKSQQCRVFVLLQSSLPLAVSLFAEANKMGMMGKDYVWITTSSITSLVDSFNSSVISTMQGVIGIKPYYSETSREYQAFNFKFGRNFQLEYSVEEENPNPGIFALRAYDSIWTVARAIEKNSKGGEKLVESILASNFSGLSGKINFKDEEFVGTRIFQIVNVFGKSYREIGFWSLESGFSNSAIGEEGGEKLEMNVFWPGGKISTPRGWVATTDGKPLRIGVPVQTAFNQFVKIVNGSVVTGFCIEVFEEAVKLLPYDLPHMFVPYHGTYDDLIKKVYYKTFDAVVGDTTILTERSRYVEFSQSYAESGLGMLVAVKEEASRNTWLFIRPFTKSMWIVTGTIFIYTGLVVWFLEHPRNPDFRGPWWSQLGTMLSTLFFADSARLRSNFSRVVFMVWLFVVIILNASYLASLTSMLTVESLGPPLRKNDVKVGCDTGAPFIQKYLQDVLHFPSKNIIEFPNPEDYIEALISGRSQLHFLSFPISRFSSPITAKDLPWLAQPTD